MGFSGFGFRVFEPENPRVAISSRIQAELDSFHCSACLQKLQGHDLHGVSQLRQPLARRTTSHFTRTQGGYRAELDFIRDADAAVRRSQLTLSITSAVILFFSVSSGLVRSVWPGRRGFYGQG